MTEINYSLIKFYYIRILFFIALITIISFYSMKIKLTSPPPILTISKNHSILTTTTTTTTTISQKQTIFCIVYIDGRSGRLGNRMFMIASAYGLARLHSCHLYLSSEIINEINSIFILDLSPILISPNTFNNLKPMNRSSKEVVCHYVPELTRPNAIQPGHILQLNGFWQSYLHFAKYGDELRERIFVATKPVLEKVSTLFIDIHKKRFNFTPQFSLDKHQIFKKQLGESDKATWIGIHVRRLDFTQLKFSSSDEYVLNAIEYFTTRFANAHFIVASDDKSHCENLLRNRPNIHITPHSFSTGDDLVILSLCQHSIITGGTFGWWAAFLADGLVIHDKVYPSGCERREYYYPPWFLINGNVRAHKNTDYIL